MNEKYMIPDPPLPEHSSQWWKANSIIGLGVIIFLFMVALSAGLAYFSLNQQPRTSNSTTPSPTPTEVEPTSTPTPSATPSPTPTRPSTESMIKVYFSRHPESDSNFQQVYEVTRTTSDASVATVALNQLITGPTAAEQQQGLYSEWKLSGTSSCGDSSFSLSVQSGKATMKLCKDFSSAGTGQDARAQAEADATLKQFTTITKTVYLDKNGNCLFDQSGQNKCLAE